MGMKVGRQQSFSEQTVSVPGRGKTRLAEGQMRMDSDWKISSLIFRNMLRASQSSQDS